MIKQLLAIAVAAACAGILVLAPELPAKSAMAATQSPASAPTRGLGVTKEARQPDGGCVQHWPYYEPGCLRDARLASGAERVARLISMTRTGKH